MDILIKTLAGKRYRLIKQDRAAAMQKKRPFDKTQLTQMFKQASPETPGNWPALWQAVKPIGKKPLEKTDEIIAALIEHALSGDIDIVERENKAPSPKGSAGSTGGGSSSSAPANLGAETRDKRVEDRELTSSPEQFSEKDAAVSDQPSAGGPEADQLQTSGDPVSMISGEEVLRFTDATLPGPMPFAFIRTYRSGNPKDSGLGHGWSHAAHERLDISDTRIIYRDAEAREVPFALPRVGQRSKHIPEGWNLDRLSENAFALRREGEWDRLFTRPDVSVRQFRLTQLRHPGYVPGNITLGVTTPESGYCIRINYNEHNQIARIRGNWGHSLVLERGDKGRIARIHLREEASGASKVVAEYDYDESGDLVAQRNARGVGEHYRYNNHLIVQRTLKTGFNFYFEWDGDDHNARCIHNWGDRGIYEYLFTWEPENNCSRTTDSRGFTTQYRYNEYGHIVETIDNEGHVHQYEYQRGRRTRYTDPEGHSTEYFYDSENHPVGYRDALGNAVSLGYFNGKATTFIDKDKTHWRREYNRKGQLVALRDPYNQSTGYTYNRNGLVESVTDPMGRVTQYHWSDSGELVRIVDAQGHTRKFRYDEWRQVVAVEFIPRGENKGAITVFDYDVGGNIIAVTLPNGDTSSYTYNDNDQLIKHSDPQGRTTEFIYDGLSQVVERVDAEGHRLKYEYDTERNLTAIYNEKGESYQFFYDANERLIKEIGFDGRVQQYQYNKAGHLIKHMDAGQVLTEFERDALGRMLTKTCKAKPNGQLIEEKSRYQYDAKGRLLECYNGDQYLAFEYNRFGNIRKEHHSDLNAHKQRIPATMVDIEYSYIWPGIRSGITLPDGQRIDYEFDRANLFTGVTFNGESLATLERDPFGRELARNQGELRTESHYDPMGRLAKQQSFNREHKAPGPVQREYHYDKFGNLSGLTDGPEETRYVYDLINRLSRVEGQENEQFHFDPAGNLLSMSGESLGKSAGNRLAMQGDRKFLYDARGNLIQENRGKDGKLVTHFHYNLNNQLVKVEKDGQSTEYTYDPLGRRIEKRDAFGSTKYLWAADQLAQEQRNNIKKTYIYEPESFRPLAMVQDGHTYHYHLDHLGTPRELTDTQGKVVWKARYRTYGSVTLKEVEDVENNLRFQGQYFDEETGLHYNRHRYYNPQTGQFITQDPIGLLGGLNGYQYAPNPVAWIDPLGLTCKENKYTHLKSMDEEYLAEDIGFAKAWADYGNPEIDYLETEAERSRFEVFVENKKIVDRNGVPLDSGSSNTGKLIFVMDPQGRIFAGEPRLMEFHHSSLLAGAPVAAAGEMMIIDGVVVSHSRKSGHYKPNKVNHDQFKSEMLGRGLDLSSVPEDPID